MADYKVKISYDDQGTGKKLDELDKKVKSVAKDHKISFTFPDLGKVKKDLQEVGKYAGIAAQAFKALTPVGREFARVEENAGVLLGTVKNLGSVLGGLSRYASPVRGISDGFTVATGAANALVRSTAEIGFAIFGVTQSVNVLKAAFGGMFEDTVGREVRLRESILQTATTLAGTNRVFADGFEVEDPTEKLKALERPINESIERIREKSLEIAGTTSEAVISTFNVVAAQIGSFGGTLKDAEDLAVKFSGALGTLGMSNPMYARQEIGSIMMGYVDNNSILAKTIGITNEDIAKAKKSAGGLVEYLNKKLETFSAGQAMAAKGFRGITSNIKELSEEMKRSFGAQLLDPILKRIEKFYEGVSGKETLKALMETAKGFGSLVGSSLNSAFSVVSSAPVFKGLDGDAVTKAANKIQEVMLRMYNFIQDSLARIAPYVQDVIDRVIQAVAILGRAFASMIATLGRVKLDQFVVQIQLLSKLTPAIVLAAQAYEYYLETLEAILNTPAGRYFNELNETMKLLEKFGVKAIISNVIAMRELKAAIPQVIAGIQSMAASIGAGFRATFTFISTTFATISNFVTGLIASVTTSITAGLATASAAIAAFFARIGVFLRTLSITVKLMGGDLALLEGPLGKASNSILKVAAALEKAEINATEFGVKIRAAMTAAQTSSAGAATSISNVGRTLQTNLARGATAATTAIGGLVKGFVAAMTTMALWTVGIALVVDGLRRLSDWWDNRREMAEYKLALDDINNGLAEQAKRAREAGVALGTLEQARVDRANATANAQKQKDIDEYLKLEEELLRREKNLNTLYSNNGVTGANTTGKTTKELALERDPAFEKRMKEVKARIDEAQAALDELNGTKDEKGPDNVELRQNENIAAIKSIADFEKATRRTIEDEVYNYRKQIQSKEIELWRQQGQLRIAQADEANRRLIEGANAEARTALTALANWISTKKKGEMDIEERKREAQITLAELERNLGRFRENLEKQVLDIRSKIGQYEIDVLDKRIKGEQLIANIRNGSVEWDSPGQTGNGVGITGNTGLKMGSTGQSTGPHWHVGGAASEAEARAIFARGAEGKLTSTQGMRRHPIHGDMRMHNGYDLSGAALKDLVLAPGYKMVGWRPGGNGGMGNVVVVEKIDSKKQYQLGHTADAPAGWSFDAAQRRNAPGFNNGDFVKQYMLRMSNLEGGYGIGGSSALNPKSKAKGYFQLLPSTEADLRNRGMASMADQMLSTDINTAIQGAYRHAITKHPITKMLFAEGDVAGLDRMLNQTWTSLPGGTEAATGERLTKGNAYLTGGNAGGGGSGGNAGIGAVGGAPGKPEVTLNLDTSGLDAAITSITDLNNKINALAKDAQIFQNETAFQGFIKSLDLTSDQLAQMDRDLEDSRDALRLTTEAADKGIYDPKLLELELQREKGLNMLDRLKKSMLEYIPKMTEVEADRKRAVDEVNKAYTTTLENLTKVINKSKEQLTIERDLASIAQRRTDAIDIQKQLLSETFNARASAAEATLGENDFVGRRRLGAQRSIYQRYLEMSKGGTEQLSATDAETLARFAEGAMKSAESLAALDKELNSFAERLQMAREAASTITDGFKGMISSVLKGGDIGEAASEMASSVADRFTSMFLEYAFKPMEVQLEKLFSDLFGVDSAQDANTTALGVLTTSINALNATLTNAAPPPPAPDVAPPPPPNTDAPPPPTTSAAEDAASGALSVNTEIDKLGTTLKKVKPAAEDAITGFQKTMGGIASLAAGAMAIYGGISKMGEGGTHNTLMGLAGIFAGIGGIAGSFAPGGGLAGLFKADGGPVSANRPYIVGERGPELFMSASAGTIIPNHSLPFQLGGSSPESASSGMDGSAGAPGAPGTPGASGSTPFSKASAAAGSYVPFSRDSSSSSSTSSLIERSNRETIEAIASAGSLRVEVESQVINGVEYITADQHRRGMEQAANRGRDLTLSSLQNSLRSRRRIGL